jgi:hypothetical protein
MCYLHPCSFRGNYQFCDIFSAVRLQSLKNNFLYMLTRFYTAKTVVSLKL